MSATYSRSHGGGGYGIPVAADAFLSLGCMEGLYEHVVEAAPTVKSPGKLAAFIPGYAFAAVVAVAAYGLQVLPFAPFTIISGSGVKHTVSAAIIAILLGLLLRNTLSLPAAIKAGCKSVVKRAIPIAIVMLGAELSFSSIAQIGGRAIALTMLCLVLALTAGYYAARMFGLSAKTAMLLGVGTGICGNSAIVAVAPLIDADDDDLVLSIGTVNLFGLLAMLAWPAVGAALEIRDEAFGVWSGVSIHAVPQVVAAGFAYSVAAGKLATLVKLFRVALLAPLVFVLSMVHARRRAAESKPENLTVHYTKLVPWFVWGFVLLALMNTMGLIPTLGFELAPFLPGGAEHVSLDVGSTLTKVGQILLTFAMAAIGLEVNLRQLAGVGGKAVLAGLVSTAALGAASLLLVHLLL